MSLLMWAFLPQQYPPHSYGHRTHKPTPTHAEDNAVRSKQEYLYYMHMYMYVRMYIIYVNEVCCVIHYHNAVETEVPN